MKFCTENED